MCYPHNLQVEIVSVGGIPMLLLFLAIFGVVLYRGIGPARRGDGLSIIFLGLFVHGIMGVQTSGSMAHEMMPWIAGVLVLARAEELEDAAPTPRPEPTAT